jgi:hypothetical protein
MKEHFLVSVLGRRLLPLLQLLPTVSFVVVVLPMSPLRRWLSSLSSYLRPCFDGGGLLDAISSFFW